MEKVYVVAVDSGKFLTKAVQIENGEVANRFSIETKMRETEEVRAKVQGTHVVTLNGVSTLMGVKTLLPDVETTKERDIHRRSTYLSISQLIPNGSKIVLAIGFPVSMYMREASVDSYQRFMLGVSENDEFSFPVKISFEVDGNGFEYTVEELITFPETSGYLMKRADEYAGYEVGIIDIGGLNVNGAKYTPVDSNDPNSPLDISEEFTFTLDEGVHFFTAKLRDRLNTDLNLQLSDGDMSSILLNGCIRNRRKKSLEESSREIVSEEKKKFVEKIKKNMVLRNWSVKTLDIVFVGGGSILLSDAILEDADFQDVEISDNAQWENVEGFGLVAESVLKDLAISQ